MGSVSTIYFSDETLKCLEEQKRKDPNFNLSSFISRCLQTTFEIAQDPAEIKLEIDKKNAQVNVLKNEIDVLSNRLRRVELEIENKKKEDEEKAIKDEKKKIEKLNMVSDNIHDFYDIDPVKSRQLAEQFLACDKETRGTVFDFMKNLGYERKDAKN